MTRQGMETRRLKALELFRAGKSQSIIARTLEVTRTTASRWARLATTPNRMMARKATGRPCKLTDAELRTIIKSRDRWTGEGLRAELIRAVGITYSRDHCYRLMEKARTIK